MKLALARAMLMNADIMLLDEPTNHLDVTNVQWLVDYLNSLTHVRAACPGPLPPPRWGAACVPLGAGRACCKRSRRPPPPPRPAALR